MGQNGSRSNAAASSASAASSFISSFFHAHSTSSKPGGTLAAAKSFYVVDPTNKRKVELDPNNCLVLLQQSLLGLKQTLSSSYEEDDDCAMFALHNENKQSCLGFICENWFCLTNSKQGRRQVLEQLSEQGLKELLLSDGLRVSSEWECLLLVGSWAVLQLKKEDLRKEKEELLLQNEERDEGERKQKEKGMEKEEAVNEKGKGKEKENCESAYEEEEEDEMRAKEEKKIDLRATRGRFNNVTTVVVESQLKEGEKTAASTDDELLQLPIVVEEQRPFIYGKDFEARLQEKMLPLMGYIRFPMMSDFQLSHLESETNLVPVELLTEAVKHRLNRVMSSPSLIQDNEQNLRRRRRRQYNTLKWDSNRKCSVVISENCNTVSLENATICDCHRIAIATQCFVSGQASWTIEALTDANCYAAVGVVSPSFRTGTDIMGVAEGSWALCLRHGTQNSEWETSRRRGTDLGIRLLKGQTVQVELDLDIGMLSFYIDDCHREGFSFQSRTNSKMEEKLASNWPWGEFAERHPGPGILRKAAPSNGEGTSSSALFAPLKIRELTLKNRVVVSPMCQYSAEDGFWQDWHLVHLGSFANGGAGLITFEATAVEPRGRITPWDTGLWKDEHIPALKRIVDFVHSQHTAACLQIAHAGRKASTWPPHLTFKQPRAGIPDEKGGWEVVGPSEEAWGPHYRQPHELTQEEIQEIVKHFGDAAERADKAGFDALEIHGAHGYLISSFNSPIANKRTDEYGGSFQNRTRFCIEVTQEVRKRWPQEKPLLLRLSCSDWMEGGWDIEQTIKLANIVRDLGVDVLDCSSSGQSPQQKMQTGPGYQVPFAEAVKTQVEGLLVCAVGEITSAAQAEEILKEGKADLVAIGRQLLRDPFWTLHAAKELGVDVHHAVQYEWAVNRPKH
ncbi:NADH-dependent flavin oxidoreductase-like protein [Balamuthia mandrillaris]